MNILYGVHGTSKSRKESIIKNGFKMGPGRGGTGVYFWRKSRESQYTAEISDNLAYFWWQDTKNDGKYKDDANLGFARIEVEIQVLSENEILDLENPTIRDRFFSLAVKRNLDFNRTIIISRLYDKFITKLEEDLQTKYKVLSLRVAWPKSYINYPVQLYGAPISYIARTTDNIKIISGKE